MKDQLLEELRRLLADSRERAVTWDSRADELDDTLRKLLARELAFEWRGIGRRLEQCLSLAGDG